MVKSTVLTCAPFSLKIWVTVTSKPGVGERTHEPDRDAGTPVSRRDVQREDSGPTLAEGSSRDPGDNAIGLDRGEQLIG